MKRHKIFATLIVVLLCNFAQAQERFKYTYDETGNRIKRQFMVEDGGGPIDSVIDPILPPILTPDPENTLELSVYPNPTNGAFTLKVDNSPAITKTTPAAIMIFNSSQVLVLNVDKVESTQVLNITGNPPGYYFVIVRVENTIEYITIIKQ